MAASEDVRKFSSTDRFYKFTVLRDSVCISTYTCQSLGSTKLSFILTFTEF